LEKHIGMRITDALKIVNGAPKDAKTFEVTLACGFTPLHLQTFLAAHLQQAMPDRRVIISTGLYGDLAGTIEGLREGVGNNLAIALEWADLDPRLGHRSPVVWDSKALQDIVSSVPHALARLANSIRAVPTGTVVLSTPTLPFPPLFHTPSWMMSDPEIVLNKAIAEFATEMAAHGIAIVNSSTLAEVSASAARYDLKSDLIFGLPYALDHADKLASSLSRLLSPPIPKKAIITDLDETLWSGIVGEIGPEKISWDLDGHAGIHALYQSFLASLAAHGILVGVASKNDPRVVEQAFERPDLLLRKEHVFPMEVHWNAKSGSVERILRVWNVLADAVVFVDDSPTELAEVAAAHPGIECILYPGKDYAAGQQMLSRLRDLFGKQRLTAEDSLRVDSIRQTARFQAAAGEANPESFLKAARATVRFDFSGSKEDLRALELVNKTNQFNLNGARYTESDWTSELLRADTRLMVTSYEDRFGRLGKIAVILGHLGDSSLSIRTWVMSCRAFGRRIEYQCLKTCFERYGVSEIDFDFSATPKNGPIHEFLTQVLGETPAGNAKLTRERFEQVCPALYHSVGEFADVRS
jgi:FkbH-like protein